MSSGVNSFTLGILVIGVISYFYESHRGTGRGKSTLLVSKGLVPQLSPLILDLHLLVLLFGLS